MECDVTDEDSLKTALNKTYEKYGRIDVLINNADLQYIASIEEFPADKFELLIKVMLAGSVRSNAIISPNTR